MNIRELIEVLNTMNPDDEVRIVADTIYPTIGSTSTASIEHVVGGFDWDNGTVLLYADTQLVKFKEENYKVLKSEANIATKIYHKNDLQEQDKINPIVKRY